VREHHVNLCSRRNRLWYPGGVEGRQEAMNLIIRSVVVGLGIASVMGAGFLIGRGRAESSVHARPGATTEPFAPDEGAKSRTDGRDRTAALELEIANLRREMLKHSARLDEKLEEDERARESARAEKEPPNIPTAEEDEKIAEARFAGFAARHQRDPVDPAWAPEAQANLKTGLAAIEKEAGIKVLETECKTEVCRAKVEWDNYEAARKTGAMLAQVTLPGLFCGQSLRLEEPLEREARYSTYVYLDCQGMRAGLEGPGVAGN
jgi:hypothetical protein